MRGYARLGLLLLLLLTLAAGGCTRLFFHPMTPHVFDPATVGIAYRAVDFQASDGVDLHGWFLPSRQEETHGTVLFLYGNAENMSTHIASVNWLPEQGFNVFMFDYRGYGKSGGRTGLAGLHLDIDAALQLLAGADETTPIIVFGQSLGGALALTAVAASPWREQVAGVVVEGAFSSYRRIAREKLAGHWLTRPLAWPFSLTVSERYRPLEAAAGLSPIPLLLVYAGDDDIVPSHHGDMLYEAARSPKWLWRIDGIGHIMAFVDDDRRRDLTRLLRQWLSESSSGR